MTSVLQKLRAPRVLLIAAVLAGCGTATAVAATHSAGSAKSAPLSASPNVAALPVSSTVNGYQYISDTFTNGAGQQNFGSVTCPAGRNATGGGVFGFSGLQQSVNSSYPIDSAADLDSAPNNGWAAYVNNNSGFATSFTVYAICRIPS
jgi:hypothetical protein